MRQSIRSLVSRCCSAIAFVGGLAAGTVLRGETIDFSGYFEERRTLDTAAALLNTFTLEEAKRSAGVLDGHLAKDPGNTVVAGLKSVL